MTDAADASGATALSAPSSAARPRPSPDAIELRPAGRKGRAVHATRAIRAGEVLDAAHTAELTLDDTDRVRDTTVDHYYFAHPSEPGKGLLVFGIASLLNHSPHPNAGTHKRHEPGIGWILEIHALRDIAPGEEVTIHYDCELWFDPEPAAGN